MLHRAILQQLVAQRRDKLLRKLRSVTPPYES